MKTKTFLAVAAMTLATGLGAGYLYFNRGVAVIVKNVGDRPIQSVVIQATGFSGSLGHIAAGHSKQVDVLPSGKSRFELEHADGPRLIINCYFENGYTGSISIDVAANRLVRKECNLRTGFL